MADVSLNAGWDDDDLAEAEAKTPTLQNDPLVTTTEVDDLPEVDYETDKIAASTDALESLLFVVEDIMKTRGMTQAIATEALKYFPEFDGQRPLGYYTKAPSATRLQPSLESISNGVWALIAAGVAAVGVLIVKLLRWMMGLKNTSGGNAASLVKDINKKAAEDEKNAAAVEKGLSSIHSQLDKLNSVLEDGVEVKAPEGHSYFPNNVEAFARMVISNDPDQNSGTEFLEGRNPFFYDLLTNGAYTEMVTRVIPAAQTLGEILTVKIDLIKQIVETSNKNDSAGKALMTDIQLSSLVKPLSLNVAGKESTINTISNDLSNQREATGNTTPKIPVPIDVVVLRTAATFQSDHAVFQIIDLSRSVGEKLGEMEALLASLKLASGAINNDRSPVNPDALVKTGNNIRLAIEAIQHDVADLGMLLKQLEHYRLICVNLGERVVQFVEQTAMKMLQAVTDTALPSVQKEISNLQRIARETRKSQLEHFKRIFPDGI